MEIDKILSDGIIKEQEEYKNGRTRSGKFNFSAMGQCYRRIVWSRQDKPKSNEPDVRVLKIFRVGNMFHNDIQSFLPKDNVEVVFENEDFSGRVDWLEDGFVADFKTMAEYQYGLVIKKNFDVNNDKRDYILQIMTACYFLDRPKGYLIFIHKDTYSMKIFEFKLSLWKGVVEKELATMREWWEAKELPPAVPRLYKGRECTYCNFKNSCQEMEKGKNEKNN